MNSKLKRIHLLGGPGSGKSYAAKKLSKLLKIPHFDLDELHWDNKSKKYGTKTPVAIRDKKLNDILKRNKWIVEGVYYDWVSNGFLKADKIIILKSNVYLRDWRIIKRFILRKIGFIKSKKESLKGFLGLLRWNHTYDKGWLIKAEHQIKKFRKKAKYFNKADAAVNYILKLNSK